MRTSFSKSFARSRSLLFATIAACALGTMLTCTISDENGEPANPGVYNPNNPDTTGGGNNNTANPGFIVSYSASQIQPGDTVYFIVTLIDQNARDTINNRIRLARVTSRVSPSMGRFVPDTVETTNGAGRAYFAYTDTATGDRQVSFAYGTLVSPPIRITVTPVPIQPEKLINVRAEKSSLSADGKSFTYIHVTAMNEQHNPLVGEQVAFMTTAGVIAGAQPPSPALSGISVTNEDGVATAKLTSTNLNDTAIITVYLVSDLSMNDETKVNFTGVHIKLTIDTTNLAVNQTTLLAAELLNGSDEPISQMPIYFLLGKGSSSNFTILSKDSVSGFDGTASALLRGTASGTDSIIVAAAGARAVLLVNVTSLKLTATLRQTNLVASDTVKTYLDVTFTDQGGNPLVNKFIRVVRTYPNANQVEISDDVTANTDASGKAEIEIRGVPYDAIMRLAITATNAVNDVATAETSLRFSTTRNLTIEALPTIIPADGSSQSEITVIIKTDQNNPVVGDTVVFSSTAGLIKSWAVTDSFGQAVAHIRSDRRNFVAVVTAVLKRDITRRDSVQVVFNGVNLVANAAPRSIRGNNQDTSYISVMLSDAMGNPIPGEPINFTPQQLNQTRIIAASQVTDNRGEAFCKVVGIGSGTDTLSIVAAGANARPVVFYSTNILTIDTLRNQPVIANGRDSTGVQVTYTRGDGTPLANVRIKTSVTLGSVDTLFARELTTNSSGVATFYMRNPTFANTATISAEAVTASEITTSTFRLYFRAARIHHIDLTVTPKTISTGGQKSTVVAIAYDSLNNRVANELVAFNLLEGPGGGEKLDPPTAITGIDGIATTSLVSGTVPSMFNEVRIVAGDYAAVKSDTALMTIAGPPKYITVRSNILKGVNPNDGTFELPCAAIVTDINGNPVADGTAVTFSVKISGYVFWKYASEFIGDVDTWVGWVDVDVDTVYEILPFEDFNDNFRLDPGEDRNSDGVSGRGEDVNGDGKYITGPGFEDINHNGIRDVYGITRDPPEPFKEYMRPEPDSTVTSGYRYVRDTAFADYNRNGRVDLEEPLLNSSMTWTDYVTARDGQPGGLGFDRMFDDNGVPDPATAVKIRRTVQTVDGKATNAIVYGQSDAMKIQVTVTAEAQGVVTIVPDVVILPVIE